MDEKPEAPLETIRSLMVRDKEREVNPFLLTGVQPYILRTLAPDVLKTYLRKQLTLLQQVTHPDVTGNDPALTSFFRNATAAIQGLLKDDFTFKKRLKEFVSTDIVDQLHGQNRYLQVQVADLTERIKSIENQSFQANTQGMVKAQEAAEFTSATVREYIQMEKQFDSARKRNDTLKIKLDKARKASSDNLYFLSALLEDRNDAILIGVNTAFHLSYVKIDMHDVSLLSKMVKMGEFGQRGPGIRQAIIYERESRSRIFRLLEDDVKLFSNTSRVVRNAFTCQVAYEGQTKKSQSTLVGSLPYISLKRYAAMNNLASYEESINQLSEFLESTDKLDRNDFGKAVNGLIYPIIAPYTPLIIKDKIIVEGGVYPEHQVQFRMIMPTRIAYYRKLVKEAPKFTRSGRPKKSSSASE